MKLQFATLILIVSSLTMNAQDILKISDFEVLDESKWKGQLTYKDYQSGKLTSIDATMQISISDNKIIANVQYTYEPEKNITSKIKIKKNGRYYGNEEVISNSMMDGVRTFVTSYDGRDNNKKATMYMTHQFSNESYKVIKEVQYLDGTDRFVRNMYQFSKIQ